jgi:hypothetical protein
VADDPHNLTELQAAAEQARFRLARHRRRLYLGSGSDPRRLAELERSAELAETRLRRAREAAQEQQREPPPSA